jgi:hypothetical protein
MAEGSARGGHQNFTIRHVTIKMEDAGTDRRHRDCNAKARERFDGAHRPEPAEGTQSLRPESFGKLTTPSRVEGLRPKVRKGGTRGLLRRSWGTENRTHSILQMHREWGQDWDGAKTPPGGHNDLGPRSGWGWVAGSSLAGHRQKSSYRSVLHRISQVTRLAP